MITPSTKPRALLLDLDGTIADTLPHVFEAFRHAVAPWVEKPPTDAEIEATFGPSERDCVALLAPRADLGAAVSRFHEYHEAEHGRGVRVAEGVPELIDEARARGWRVGVFTGKARRPAVFSLVDLGLWDRVEHLVSGDDVARRKPDPEGVFLASAALNVPADRILMAGDSPCDIEAGRDAGSKTAAALWVALRPQVLRDAGADFVCETVKDLGIAINTLDAVW